MERLSELWKRGAPIDEIAAALNALPGAEQVRWSRGLSGREQARLWRLCEGRSVSIDAIVPPAIAPLRPVVHEGRNSLPLFQLFEKHFCRPTVDSQELWGYNEGVTRGLVGPGYFVCEATPGDPRGEVVINYERVPPETISCWPPLRPNEAGLSRFVYAGMQDFLRKVSDRITIGRAWRAGKETGNYFTLCRAEET